MVVNATIVETDRVRKVEIRPYDQVFALTQYVINEGLKTNWKSMCDADPKLGIPFGAAQPGAGTISKAVLDAPRIMVEADTREGLSGVLYFMCFKAGKFVLNTAILDESGEPKFDDEGEPMVDKKEFNITGWNIAFAMQLGLTVDERKTDEFKRIVLKGGEYSLNQLQAKFDTAIFKPDRGVYGDKRWGEFPTDIQNGLEFCFGRLKNTLLNRLKGAEKIGSVLKSTKPQDTSKPGMYFEPHAIQYQTYPWKDPNSMQFTPSSGFDGNQRLNYLLYCETTNGRELPPSDQRSLPRNGNWTDGRMEATANSGNAEFGSFHMARENFFEGYLLKKLRVLNKVMEPYGTYNNVRLTDIMNIKTSWDSDLAIGNRGASVDDPIYNWKQESNTKWVFTSDVALPESFDQAGANGWSGQAWASSYANVENTVEFVPGSDLITVRGKTSFAYTYKFIDKHWYKSNEEQYKELTFDIKWSLNLDLEAVEDGGLQILATFVDPVTTYKRRDLADSFHAAVTLEKKVKEAVDATKDLKNALVQDFANKQGLILPAEGVFFFKNPILSWRGDLICSIGYSTVLPEKMLDPTDHTKINVDGKERATF